MRQPWQHPARRAEVARLKAESLEAAELTADETARVLGLSLEATRRRLRAGRIPGRKLPGGPKLGWRVPRAAVLQIRRSQEATA